MIGLLGPLIGGLVKGAGIAKAILPFAGKAVLDKMSQDRAYRFEGQKIQMLARDARAAGIHPLAAMGAASGYQNPFGSSPAGNALGDGINAFREDQAAARQERADAPLRKKQSELLDAQIAEARSRTTLNQANAHRTLVGPAASLDPYAPRKENALISVRLENGETVLMPNPDLYEISPTELATGRVLIEGARQVDRQIEGRPGRNQGSRGRYQRRGTQR